MRLATLRGGSRLASGRALHSRYSRRSSPPSRWAGFVIHLIGIKVSGASADSQWLCLSGAGTVFLTFILLRLLGFFLNINYNLSLK